MFVKRAEIDDFPQSVGVFRWNPETVIYMAWCRVFEISARVKDPQVVRINPEPSTTARILACVARRVKFTQQSIKEYLSLWVLRDDGKRDLFILTLGRKKPPSGNDYYVQMMMMPRPWELAFMIVCWLWESVRNVLKSTESVVIVSHNIITMFADFLYKTEATYCMYQVLCFAKGILLRYDLQYRHFSRGDLQCPVFVSQSWCPVIGTCSQFWQ